MKPREKEQLAFEINFYEKLLKRFPDFADALVPLAEAYTRSGLYEKGLSADLKLARLRKKDPVVWYNVACSYALLNRPDDAFSALKKAVRLGYRDANHLTKDPDLKSLRKSKRFEDLLALLRRAP